MSQDDPQRTEEWTPPEMAEEEAERRAALARGAELKAELRETQVRRAEEETAQAHDEVEAAERVLLDPLELVDEVSACLRHQPNLPVTYSSVRESEGFVKIVWVSSNSTSSPASMNAVLSATRPACCMLCVTITIV